ncbi:hypothetical protein RIR_jg2058.t1 [Rhizophagus irregularis DAOM 181602=DAOM 197198]|nr:hypothetical protein RIR_jg2058.t1 [Rhizophagus irregularis DAOM 181602=DAOM 197198]
MIGTYYKREYLRSIVVNKIYLDDGIIGTNWIEHSMGVSLSFFTLDFFGDFFLCLNKLFRIFWMLQNFLLESGF